LIEDYQLLEEKNVTSYKLQVTSYKLQAGVYCSVSQRDKKLTFISLRKRSPSLGNMLKELTVNLNFNYYKKGEKLKKYLILMFLMFSLLAMATATERSFFEKKLNNIVTLRVLGVTPAKIWDDLGVGQDVNFYFNEDYDLYECKDFQINNEYCTKIYIDNDFPYHIKDSSIIKGYAYVFNNNDVITKENSYIIAKNYVIDENYSYDKGTGLLIDNDCIYDDTNDCIISDGQINNIIENLTPFYNSWKLKETINNNYTELIRNINITTLNIISDSENPFKGTSSVPKIPYNAIRVALTANILNNLNIAFERSDINGGGNIYINNNSGEETDFSCEIYKLIGHVPFNNLFNMDLCDLENTFSHPENILGVEKRVLYQKVKPKDNSNFYFDDTTKIIKEKGYENSIDTELENSNPINQSLISKLTNEWSDDLIVNTNIFTKATKLNINTFSFLTNKDYANQNLWKLVSIIINRTFQFYEKKAKAKARIKQFMELKSIGLFSNYRWQELGFNSYKNNVKSEIEVDDLLSLYDNFYAQDLNTITGDNYKRIFTDSKYNILFLANLLKKLNLKMINGKLYHDYDAEFIINLIKVDKEKGYEKYREELLLEKDAILVNFHGSNEEFLVLFFKLQTLNKLIEVLKTNGFKKTIPNFKSWLEYQTSNGIYKDIYSQFSQEYIDILVKVLDSPKDESISSFREILIDSYDNLVKESRIEENGNYEELSEIYSKLENIEIITSDYSNLDNAEEIESNKSEYFLKNLMNLREISPVSFQNMVLSTKNLLYNKNTNLYFIYKPYKENINTLNANDGLKRLLVNNIIITDSNEEVFNDISSYANFSYYLSSILISSHHSIYEIAGEIIKNLSFSEKEGVNFDKWVDALNQYGITTDGIWSFFGVDRDSLLTEKEEKNIEVNKLIKNYDSLNFIVKKYLGLETYLYSESYDISSMFFDPITSLLLSRILVEKGYYVDKDENGNDAIFDINGEIIYLSLKVDDLIREVGDKYNLFNDDFANLFSNTSLNAYLGNKNNNSADLDRMMGFIKYSYTKDIRTGERNISFTFGVDNISDKYIWSRITGGIGGRAGFWSAFAKVSMKFGIPGIILGSVVSYFVGDYMATRRIENERRILNDLRIKHSGYNIIDDVENEKYIREKHNDGCEFAVIQDILHDMTVKSKEIYDKDRKTLIVTYSLLQDAKDFLKLANNPKSKKKYEADIQELEQKKTELIKKINKEEKVYKRNVQKERTAVNIIKKIKEEEKEKKEKSKPSKMCRADTYDENCDSGVGPSGDPRLILIKKGGLGKKLLELANRRIANIPHQECNIITRTCGNTIEVTANELQRMIKSIADKASSDDGSCDWSLLNGCSYFEGGNGGNSSYIDLLWDPVPPFVE